MRLIDWKDSFIPVRPVQSDLCCLLSSSSLSLLSPQFVYALSKKNTGCVIRFDSTDGRLSYTQQFLPRVNEQNEEAEGVSPAGRDIKVALMSMESLDPEPSVPLKAILKKKTNTRNHFKKEKNEECIAKTKEVFEEYGIGRDSVDHTVNVFRHLVEEELYALLASDLSTDNPLATLSSSVSSTGSDDDAWSEEL